MQGTRSATYSCFTNATSFTPYGTPATDLNGAGPQPSAADCFPGSVLTPGDAWYWRVRGYNALGPVGISGDPGKVYRAGGIAHAPLSGNATSSAVTVTGVKPATGPTTGGTSVLVTGTGFLDKQTSVRFGDAAASDVTVLSPTRLVATTPAADAAGSAPVVVSTAEGDSAPSSSSAFTYTDPKTKATPAGSPAPGGAPSPAGPAAPAATGATGAYDEVGSWSRTAAFSLAPAGPVAGSSLPPAPTGFATLQPTTGGGLVPCSSCTTTPTLRWDRAVTASGAQAVGYRVYLALDPQFSDVRRV